MKVCSVSGGKDSTALYLWMLERFGYKGFVAVMSDTGSEHPVTLNYVRNLSASTHGPRVEIIKANFSEALQHKGLTSTDVPFLDMMRTKGMPGPQRQFCTSMLKLEPIKQWLNLMRGDEEVEMYVGVRAEESARRAKLPEEEFSEFFDCYLYRPLLQWTEQQVFAKLKAHNVEPNPLYAAGHKRVGCYPCIHTGKADLARMPDWAWDRLKAWEAQSGQSFFKAQRGDCLSSRLEEIKQWAQTPTTHSPEPIDIADVPSCMSTWGVCG